MGCGLPAVACSGSGASEAVLHGETGLLIPPGDIDALAAALRQLLADPAARDAMGRRARGHVVRHASRSECLRRLEAFYAELTDRSHSAGKVEP
ncbi:MAG TPA: glycosyltransferase [Armatimonadota bacterium]|nr:glycosyltransferase [Armatimonadota bacterium]